VGDYAFCGCTALSSILLPEGVKSLGAWAFRGCTALERVVLPASLNDIRNGAFWECSSLATLALPSSVVSVEEQALRGCLSLTLLRVDAQDAPMCRRDIADAQVYASAKLCVPCGRVGEYGFAPVWEKFSNIEEV
ncbi:MAG: leucine-rich repeat domain-containing protein, partial [Bacteroidaceae bacterium]|nr:leucine-rich repeat domain-containing protein [Bacteroidaceae bacterium]